MPILEGPEPSAEVQRQLERANSQLALYARDLKRLATLNAKKPASWPQPMRDCKSWIA